MFRLIHNWGNSKQNNTEKPFSSPVIFAKIKKFDNILCYHGSEEIADLPDCW